ncbi:MAG: hypothetical protein ACM30G_07145 [Micromonosporaceae bacterium]
MQIRGVRSLKRTAAKNDLTREPSRWPIARAIAYLLTFTAAPRTRRDEPDLSEELLEALKDHPDKRTQQFGRWALGFRFGPDGEVRPLLRAAEMRRG